MSKTKGIESETPAAVAGAAPCSALTREQWLERCAAHFVKHAGFDAPIAMQYAESQLENLKDDLTENPEDAADDEMSYWTPD